jgi:hypothetical protein
MKSIIFNTEMVKAILEGKKTQFRMPIKLNIKKDNEAYSLNGFVFNVDKKMYFEHNLIETYSKYKTDDILYVKEKCVNEYPNGYCFKEDYKFEEWQNKNLIKQYCNELNARIFLKVTNVRVERLQDISNDDIYSEGIKRYSQKDLLKALENNELSKLAKCLKLAFENIWNSTAKDDYKWEDNPYVFVYEFERIK